MNFVDGFSQKYLKFHEDLSNVSRVFFPYERTDMAKLIVSLCYFAKASKQEIEPPPSQASLAGLAWRWFNFLFRRFRKIA